jgi:hypothetical protein
MSIKSHVNPMKQSALAMAEAAGPRWGEGEDGVKSSWRVKVDE